MRAVVFAASQSVTVQSRSARSVSERLLPVLMLSALTQLAACPMSAPPDDDDDDRRRRRDAVCQAGEIGCLDEQRAFICSDNGAERIEALCRDDQLCLDGVCQAQVCEPDSKTCSGNARVLCDETGTIATVDQCDTSSTCEDAGLGCACSVGFCLPRVCEPNSGRCVGNSAQVCTADGTSNGQLRDCGADGCFEGRCLPDSCTAGATFCSGRRLLTCDSDGVGYTSTACEEACGGLDGSAACMAQVCTPLSTSCADEDSIEQCNEQGTATVTIDCPASQRCQSGVCLQQACVPNSRACVGDTVRACNADGSAETLTACADGLTCANGECVEETCVPQCGARTCGPDPICGSSCGACAGSCSADGACLLPDGPVMSVELSWTPTAQDLDLHVSRDGVACAPDTCYFGTCMANSTSRPDWDGSGGPSVGDPTLDIADASSSNPELARVPLAATARSYTIGVDHYTSSGTTATATVRVSIDGALVATHTRTLQPDQLWNGVVVSWSGSSASSTDNGQLTSAFTCDGAPTQQCLLDSDCLIGEACHDGGFLQANACAPGCRTSAECGAQQGCNGERDCAASSSIHGWKQACATLADCGAGFHCDYLTQVCEEECAAGCTPGTDCCLRSGGDTCVPDVFLQLFGNCAQ